MNQTICHTSQMNTKRTRSVTICIPAHNEERTIGFVVKSLVRASQKSDIDVDSILVIDDRCSDRTAQIAARVGARVVFTEDHCRHFGGSRGKGDAIWTSLKTCTTDLIGWVDGDLAEINPESIIEMFRPLINDDEVQLVKGGFTRLHDGCIGEEGRVTALTARPLLDLLHPNFPLLRQPLSGIFAGRTKTIGALWLDCDYGVDIGISLDINEIFGPQSIIDLNVGFISHRQRPLTDLTNTASQVARAIVSRAGISASLASDFENRRAPALGRQAVIMSQ